MAKKTNPTNETVETVTIPTLIRANRIAVTAVDTGYQADFYRTHKKLATLLSSETGFEADASANKSAVREAFRQFAIEHSADIGIDWNPADLRTAENVRIAKYDSDEALTKDATALIEQDMLTLTAKCPHGISYISLDVDTIEPVAVSGKGTDLSKLGVIDGKYEKSGNWAWANLQVILTLTKDGQEIYYTTTIQLVSGQLKKPHITQTAFNEEVKKSLIEAGIITEESKESTKDSKDGKEAK